MLDAGPLLEPRSTVQNQGQSLPRRRKEGAQATQTSAVQFLGYSLVHYKDVRQLQNMCAQTNTLQVNRRVRRDLPQPALYKQREPGLEYPQTKR